MTDHKISVPDWFFKLDSSQKLLRYMANVSPLEDYFESLKLPYIGIVVNESDKYAYIVEFTDSTFKTFKDIKALDFGEQIVVMYDNIENKHLIPPQTEKQNNGIQKSRTS